MKTATLNNAYAIWAGHPTNTTHASAGFGNTLTNTSTIETASNGAVGMYARTRHATQANTIINTGTITTTGGTAVNRAASGIRTESRGSSTINNSGTIMVNSAGSNGIEVNGTGVITNTGTVTSAQGCGVLGSDLTQGATTYSGLTLNHSGTISGTAGCAIELGGGADTIILQAGSVLNGSIDGGGTGSAPAGAQDKLIFDDFISNNFNNTLLSFNLLQATGDADVNLTATSYAFDEVQVDVDATLTFTNTTLTATDIVNDGTLTFTDTTLTATHIDNYGHLTFHSSTSNTLSSPSITNHGSVHMLGTSNVGRKLTAEDYEGDDGIVFMNADLGTLSSDELIITDTLTGSTTLHITNIGGLGAQTTGDGILVVNASGATITEPASFTLPARLVAGNYEYTLHRNDINGIFPNNWYLRSTLIKSSTTSIPTLNPAALVLLAMALAGMVFQQRRRRLG